MHRWMRLCTAMLASATLALTAMVIAPTAARADAADFQLNGHTFGPNAYVTIDIGTLTRDCDTFWTTSDIYIVPSGSVSSGGALSDVSGSPNTLMGTGLGSGVFDEVIAITAPGGTVGPGVYDVVEDTCQNGVFDGTDSILSNAFEVVIPTDVPVLPDPRIQEMKSGATAQAKHFASAAKAYAALFAATTAYSMINDALDPVGFYLTYVCLVMPEIPDSPVSPWCPTVSITDLIHLQLDVVKTIVDRASYYKGIAADPPDPSFAEPSVPGARDRIQPRGDGALPYAIAAWASQMDEVNELSAAFLGSLEKYQGAAQADDAVAALQHAHDIQSYARLLNTALSQESSAHSTINSAASTSGINTTTAFNRLRAMLTALDTDGLNADAERRLRNLGATPEQLDEFTTALLTELAPADVPASFAALANPLISVNNQMSSAYTDLGNAMNTVIADLQSVVAGRGQTEYPRITGSSIPSSMAADTPRALTATCANCTDIAWDLDGDGAFDDADGASISAVFPDPGRLMVGIRGTDADGRNSVLFVRTNITTSNRAPTHSDATPPAGIIEVPIGQTQPFSVTASDLDGDDLTTQWYIGSATVGTGDDFEFEADTADAGRAHNVFAHTVDPAGRAATTRWTAIPTHPDEDGDGWTANVDCDDDHAEVHPGRNEIPGNGVDDDCDAGTVDTGPPVPSFDVSVSPVIVGEDVEFTDTSTDPDGPIASRSWDLDGDGATDSTDAVVTRSYSSTGLVDVTLTVTDEDGNDASTTRTINVTDRPVAAFSYTPVPVVVGNPVSFADESTDDDGIASWEWDFDYDGALFTVDSTEQDPQHVFGTAASVALRVTDSLGAVSTVTTTEIAVSGPPQAAFSPLPSTGLGDVARAEHGGSAVLWSSQYSAATGADEMIDTDYPAGEVGWSTGNGLVRDQWAVLDLGAGDGWQIEAVGLQPGSTTSERPQHISIGLSTSGTAPSGFATVLEHELANSAELQVIDVDTLRLGRWLRYDIQDNRGSTTRATTQRLQALTGQIGGPSVSFRDRSVDGDGPDDIKTWYWEFGDGATSSEQNPTHVYAAPGDYRVTLTVTDADGLSSSRTLTQRVVGEPVAPVLAVPAVLNEGSSATFRDDTEAAALAGRAIVSRTWDWGDGASTAGSVSANKNYADDGEYDVTLTVIDSFGRATSSTQKVSVANRPPTVSAGADLRAFVREVSPGVFGSTWSPAANVSDPSTVDRATLTCLWDFGDGSTPVEIQTCTSTNARVSHVFPVGEFTATLTVTDKDGASTSDTATIVVERSKTYLNVTPVPGTVADGRVSARVKLWNADGGFTAIAGAQIDVALGGESRTVTTDDAGEALLQLPLGAERELTAAYSGSTFYLASADAVQIPTAQRPPGDIVFTVDESGSMGGVQARIRDNVVRIANQLADSLDYQISVMGFGGGFAAVDGVPGYLPRIIVPATDDLADVASAAAQLTTGGGTEPGIDAIVAAVQPNVGLRAGAGTCVVLVGDEPTQRYRATDDDAARALADGDAILFSIITVNSSTVAYQDLATGSGGAFFPIGEFADDPEPVLHALLDSCATALVQRPDLTVSIDDARTEVSVGETLTYTVEVSNVGPIDATGVELTVDLPDGVTFASASDGGALNGRTVTWTPFAVSAGATARQSIVVSVDPNAAAGDELTAVAEAFDDGTHGSDLTPANNVDSDVDAVVAQPSITIVTEVINDDGGTAAPPDFTTTVSDGSRPVVTDPGDADGTRHVLPVGSYLVSSSTLPGYTTVISGDCTAAGAVTLATGGDATCRITHDDIATPPADATLIVITEVVNDDGGTAVPADFTATVSNASGVLSGRPGDRDGTPHVLGGGAYLVGSSVISGYTTTIGGDCASDGAVTLTPGVVVTCIITHDDQTAVPDPGELTVVTVVINDDGGTAVPADASVVIDSAAGRVVSESGSAGGAVHQLEAGDYTVAGALPGYTTVISGDCDADGRVQLPAGDARSCTITHDDVAVDADGQLTVITRVVNAHGGTLTPQDAQLSLVSTATTTTIPGTTAGERMTVPAGSYRVAAGSEPGYALVLDGDCDASGVVSVPASGAVVCTVTYSDVPGSVTVLLFGDEADVRLTIDGYDAGFDQRVMLSAGLHFVVATAPVGYAVTIRGACTAEGAVTIGLDQHRTCEVVASAPVDGGTDPADPQSEDGLPTTGGGNGSGMLVLAGVLLLAGLVLARRRGDGTGRASRSS